MGRENFLFKIKRKKETNWLLFLLTCPNMPGFTRWVMAYLNEFKLIGNLTKDPEFKPEVGANKTPLCILNIAVNGFRYDSAAEKSVPHTEFFNNIAVWGNDAVNCYKTLGMGSLVLIAGRLRMDEFTEKPESGGKDRRVMALVVDNVQFLMVKPRNDAGDGKA